MINKVKDFILQNNLIEKNDKVLVALSGGPDSVCLLHVLYKIKDSLNIEIGAAHVNHMLRGEEALKDEAYAESLCKKMGIQFYSTRVDINSIAKEKNISHEMAGRDERYKFFNDIKYTHNYSKIAVAHNSNDQAETVLMNMMRGTGIEGLCGIRSKRNNGIIRPILCLSRSEIENYCKENNLNPRIDKTNLEKIYSRNKVRLDILPYMQENFNEDIIDTINRMSRLLQIDNDFIEKQCNNSYKKYCITKNKFIVISKDAFLLDKAILTRLIKKSFIEFTGKHNNFEMKHIYEVIDLSKNTTNKKIDLPNGIMAENIYGDIYLKNKEYNHEKYEDIEALINKDKLDKYSFDYNNCKVHFEVIKDKNNIEFSNNVLIKYFDYDNIKEGLVIRKRKNGDKITPLGMKGNKKLKDIFIDLKVPVELRDQIPILCFDDEIAWIVGYKVSDKFKITNETKKIIKITFTRKE
ncbi:tRNA lysidine(34) synthetase TilS [Clostridium sp. MB05]|uniref:tRNA lysidine(34) synthetase TilS n=1 Tax=Clostridium sp. MB05 TaxID=3376682 RepID=UPI00398265CA